MQMALGFQNKFTFCQSVKRQCHWYRRVHTSVYFEVSFFVVLSFYIDVVQFLSKFKIRNSKVFLLVQSAQVSDNRFHLLLHTKIAGYKLCYFCFVFQVAHRS